MAIRTRGQPNRTGERVASASRRRRKRRGKRTLHYILLLFFVLVLGTILSFTVLFPIKAVEVLGVDKYSPGEVAEASGIVLGKNLLSIDKADISKRLQERFPYIQELGIRRKFPSVVEITVIQAQPVGAILQGGETVLIDDAGKVLERGVLLVPTEVPVIRGIDASQPKPGEYLGAYTPPVLKKGEKLSAQQQAEQDKAKAIEERLTMFRYLRQAMIDSGFTSLTNVDLTDHLNMKIVYENRITLELGSEAQLTDKLEMLQYVLENEMKPDQAGILDAATMSDRRWVIYKPEKAGDSETSTIRIPPPEEAAESVPELESQQTGNAELEDSN